jgi:hypothetical protein
MTNENYRDLTLGLEKFSPDRFAQSIRIACEVGDGVRERALDWYLSFEATPSYVSRVMEELEKLEGMVTSA